MVYSLVTTSCNAERVLLYPSVPHSISTFRHAHRKLEKRVMAGYGGGFTDFSVGRLEVS